MLNLLPPRFFCDFTVPRRADGSLLLSCRDSADYKTYVRWLSDYLHTADLPLSPEQQDWLLDTRPDAHQAIFACSDIYGYALFQLEDIVNDIEAGRSYEDFRAAWLKGYETELSTEDREREGPFEEWMDCS